MRGNPFERAHERKISTNGRRFGEPTLRPDANELARLLVSIVDRTGDRSLVDRQHVVTADETEHPTRRRVDDGERAHAAHAHASHGVEQCLVRRDGLRRMREVDREDER